MQLLTLTFAATALLTGQTVLAQSVMTTRTVQNNCPSSVAGDVLVTRSAVPTPVCAGNNSTKPSLSSMSGGAGGMMTMTGTGTSTGAPPAFTGAANNLKMGASAVVLPVGGMLAYLLL